MPRIVEKYRPYFPTVLFLCHDDVHSMNFILSLKNMSEDKQQQLIELMSHCGAEISVDMKDATDHSAVIVDHNEVVSCRAPAFTVNYIQTCLDKLKLQDISDYRQAVTSHIAKDVHCMDVVYYRSSSWDSVLKKAEKHWLEEKANSSRSGGLSVPLVSSTHIDILHLIDSRLGTAEHQLEDDLQSEDTNLQKGNGSKLSSDADSDIEEINGEVNVKITHQTAQCAEKSRTVEKEKDLTPKSINEIKNCQCTGLNTKSKNTTDVHSEKISVKIKSRDDIDNTQSTSVPSSGKWTFLDEFQSSSDEEVMPPETEVKETKKTFLDEIQSSSDEEVMPPETEVKETKKNFFDFEAGNEDLYKPAKDKKHSRLPYSYEEQSKILKYIIQHNEFSRVKGRELWMIMERRKICSNRTWQSMKEHFMKKIVLNLEAYDFLTERHKKNLKNAVYV